MIEKDDLANFLADSLNKEFNDGKVAYFLDHDTSPTAITDFVGTGSSLLDLAVSNRPNGGIAVGRITEINGLEASGKSLLGAHILAETQKKGGVAVYIDTETSVNKEFLNAVGLDVTNMLYLHLDTVEDVFEAVESIVTKVRESDNDRLVTILVDSLAAASTKVEMGADFDKDGWATSKAIVISKALRKITQMIGRERVALVITNQLRQKLGVMFGDQWTTSGGKALPFHASTRIRLKQMGQLKDAQKNVIGMKVRANIVKNRLGPPHRHADYIMYFDRGIDDSAGWLDFLKANKLLKQAGAWYKMNDHNGEEFKFQAKDWAAKLEDSEFNDYVYNLVADKAILKYKEDIDPDSIEVTDQVVGGE